MISYVISESGSTKDHVDKMFFLNLQRVEQSTLEAKHLKLPFFS